MATFWLGVVSGVPLMIAVGPIAVLLVEIGVGRGLRSAWPAAVGVAMADLTYATIAALCGATLQRSLHPYTSQLQALAALVLLTMAAVMFRRSLAELRSPGSVLRDAGSTPHLAEQNERASEGGLGPIAGSRASGHRLALTMTGLTLANPLTIAAFTSLVVATGERASHLGWPLGIASASLAVHLGLVAGGSALRRALPARGPAVLRLCGATFISLLAVNLLSHL